MASCICLAFRQQKSGRNSLRSRLTKSLATTEIYTKKHGVDLGDFLEAVEADASGDSDKLEELIADWNERDRMDVWQIATNMRNVNQRKSELQKNSREAYETSMQREEAEREEAYKQYIAQREGAIDTVLPKVNEKVFNLLPENKRPNVEKLKGELMNYDEWPENLKVYGILGATVLPDLVEQIQTLQNQLKETKENNVKMRSSSPSAAGGVSPRSPADRSKPVDYTKIDTDSFVSDLVKRISV